MTATPPTRQSHYLLSAWCMCPRCSIESAGNNRAVTRPGGAPAEVANPLAEEDADGGRGVLDTPIPTPEPPDPEDFV